MTDAEMLDDPELGAVRKGDEQDWSALDRYLRTALPYPLSGRMVSYQFPNGSANLTFLVVYDNQCFVVRRGPHGVIAAGAHDMEREYRVLSRLWERYPRAPRALAFCSDHSVVGSDFLVTEYRSGVVIRSEMPESLRAVPGVGGAVSEAFTAAIADLHLVDPSSCGLESLGKADGFAARQLAGWKRRWEACRPESAAPLMDEIHERLAQRIPSPSRVSLVHNDLKLDNVQFGPTDPRTVTSVFDWDMTTLGDPLIDVGTALSYWPAVGPAGAAARLLWPGQDAMGLWSREQLIDRYGALTEIDMSNIGWYEAFGSWKTAVALQQLANRALGGHTTDERLAAYGGVVPVAARAAANRLDLCG